MSIPNSRFRFFLKIWLFVSSAAVAWNALPVLARFQAEQKKLAEFEREQQLPPVPVIDLPEDSPWPTSTIQLTGHPLEGIDNLTPTLACSFGQQGQLVTAHQNIAINMVSTGQLIRSFPNRQDERNDSVAISGNGKVVATLGEFTRIRFWDASNGDLLQSIEDEYPTQAVQPDESQRSFKHSNNLRYSVSGVRRIVAAPGGCLFAIGKIDGSIEFWTESDSELPDRPDGLVTPQWPYRPDDTRPAPRSFRLLSRIQPHVGQVTDLEFTLDCQSLISISGHTFKNIKDMDVPEMPLNLRLFLTPAYENDSSPQVVKTNVATGQTEWSVALPGIPEVLALDKGSQAVVGFENPSRGVVTMSNNDAQVFSLSDGSSLNSLSLSIEKQHFIVKAIAFGDGSSSLLTAETRYVNRPDQHTAASVTVWDIRSGQRVATAEFTGQLLAASWDLHGMNLATMVLKDQEQTPQSAVDFGGFPWNRTPISPFSSHVWRLRIVPRSQH